MRILWAIFCKSFRPPNSPPPNRFFLLFSADNREKKNPASVTLTGFCCFFRRLFVELEGVEPSSKQGTRKLSTRLSFDRSFCRGFGRRRPGRGPSLLNFAVVYRRRAAISVSMIPRALPATEPSRRRGTRSADSSDGGIKPFYLVKLGSECVAVIAICSSSIQFYESPHNARRAYHQTLPAVKTGQPIGNVLQWGAKSVQR